MKFFSHKGFLQKMIIAMLCIIILFNFIVPNLATVSIADDSEATTEDDDEGMFESVTGTLSELAGIIMNPFTALINFIADTIATMLQSFMMGNAEAVTTPNVDDYAKTDVADPAEADVRIYKKYNLLGTSYPNFTFSCEEIFANKVPMLDVNFLNPSITDLGDTEVNEKHNIAARLQNIIKAWYRVLRMIAIVGLLSVLIYIGIRIMIDSNLENKAKYKERLLDWLVAFVILFSMHYIMSFILTMGEEVTDLFTGDNEETRNIVVYYDKGANIGPIDNRFFKTNLIGLARFKVQNDNLASKFAYEVIYVALLWFTVKFTVVYLKRVMYMAFLTIISPIIAFMYPIDKMNDGSAQGFQMWIKEYIFNALLQPFHYLLYTILVSSAISLAASNPLYAIVALFFISEAEKFLKQIFGFNKASAGTVGGMSSFATGALSSMVISNMKKGGALLGKEHGPQSDLNNSRLPTMNKDADSISGGDPVQYFERQQQEEAQKQQERAEALEKMRQEQIKLQQEREKQERERNMQQQQIQMQQQMQQQQRSIDEHQKQMIKQRQEEHEERRENEQQGINEGGNTNNNQQQSGTQSSNSSRSQSHGNNANSNIPHTPLNDYFVPVGENFISSSVNDYIDSDDFVPPFVEEDKNLSPASIEDYANSNSFIPFDNITNGEGDTKNSSQVQRSGNSNPQDRGNLPQGQGTINNNPPTSINLANSLRDASRNNNNRMRRQQGNSSSGVKRVLKSAIKPIWDTDKSFKSNLKRGVKRYFQFGMGAATAMVEMGASITDGKFEPTESLVSFVAGAKGGGIAWDNAKKTKDNYKNAYREGVYGVDEAAAMNYIEKWNDDDDVNKFYKDNYKEDYKDYKQVASDELLTRGIKDVEEQKQCFKYADYVKEEMQKSWENNEREVIMQQHQDYTDVQVEQELRNRKQVQADQIRDMLGKSQRQMSNDEAIQRAFMPQATKEAAQALKLRKKAAAKDALVDPERKSAFKKQQVRALQNKPENANRSVQQLERDVDIAFNKVERFDAVNNM